MAAIAAVLTRWAHLCKEQRDTIEWLTANRCHITYHDVAWWNLPRRFCIMSFGDEGGNLVHTVTYRRGHGSHDTFSDERFFRSIQKLSHVEVVEFNPIPSLDFALEIPGDLHLPSLKQLNLRLSWLSSSTFKRTQNFPKLGSLNLDNTGVDDDAFNSFPDMPQLRSLSLYTARVKGTFLSTLPVANSLETLCISNSDFEAANLPYLKRFSKLTWLDLSFTRLTDDALIQIGSLTSLEFLKIDSCYIVGTGVEELGSLTNLEELWIGDTINSFSIRSFPRFPQLKKLVLFVKTLDTRTLESISHLHTLEELDIIFDEVNLVTDTELTDSTPPRIRGLYSKEVILKGKQIERLFADFKKD